MEETRYLVFIKVKQSLSLSFLRACCYIHFSLPSQFLCVATAVSNGLLCMDVLLTIHVISISYIIASRHVFYVKEILHDNVVNENKCMCVFSVIYFT